MATRTITHLVDDLDGTQSDEIQNVRFALRGTEYEIDLTPAHVDDFETALTPYVAAARKVTAATAPEATRRRLSRGKEADNAKVRTWARRNGYDVPERGRISKEVRAAYEQAMAGSVADTATAPGSGGTPA